MTQNRKRGRSLLEDEVEFMPLSKRINNLHINNPMMTNQHTSVEWGPGPPINTMNILPDSPPSSERSLDWKTPTPYSTEYSPDLSENQNPHYFNLVCTEVASQAGPQSYTQTTEQINIFKSAHHLFDLNS
ncbi:unnamed protein product [Acanthoscelides obtectus]|uniref:Uncharacterized protein n=1 Tax=Acanthoscelides obtectus TaxID=200917 RepID=A0A9P0LAN3_ACAOB|nr:unnamed protein product [Acanthoscelides obtectus]CAK1635675.1 hypothetical protein AOBTE_LOCUS9432 [Acanthoscelides obtectus]